MPSTRPVEPYDALLVVSFGGPEAPDEVIPFLENVTRGRGISTERIAEVAQHYYDLGGRSPINDQCRALIAAVRDDFVAHGLDLPIYWGNRNWDPFLTDTMRSMAADGVRRAAVFVTSAYSSYSGCRQYREDLFRAVDANEQAPQVDKLRHYFNHPGFVEAFGDTTTEAFRALPGDVAGVPRLVFVTHSIPIAMAQLSGPEGDAYVSQHRSVAALVAADVSARVAQDLEWDLAFCSRSGPPQMPWLEPDVNDHLEKLASDGVGSVILVPIGFISDHMEVAYDLDTEAAATASRLGQAFVRAATPGTHPAFVAVVRDLLSERAAAERGEPVSRRAVGDLGPTWDLCEVGCCPNPRGPRPALCERSVAGMQL